MSSYHTAEPAASRAERQRKRERFSVQIVLEDEPLRLTIHDLASFTPLFTIGDVQSRNEGFVQILEALRRFVLEADQIDLTGLTVHDEQAGKEIDAHDYYMEKLRAHGLASYNKLARENPKRQEFHQSLVEIRQDEGDHLSLTFRSPPQWSFFWEMFYDGKPGGPVDPQRFWGFRYPLGRVYIGGRRSPSKIRPRQGFFSLINPDLPHSLPEVEEIRQMVVQLSERRGLPLALHLLGKDIQAEILSCDDLIQRFGQEDFRYGVLHFACHCQNIEEGGAEQSYLLMKVCDHELPLSVKLLEEWMGETRFRYTPFIFLNACESVDVSHLLETSNFPNVFQKFGAGGLIATACTIPDTFASAFARHFYRILLQLTDDQPGDDPYSSIGEALLKTRLHFLEKCRNPLGLAYGLYAVADQKMDFSDLES